MSLLQMCHTVLMNLVSVLVMKSDVNVDVRP